MYEYSEFRIPSIINRTNLQKEGLESERQKEGTTLG